MLLFVKGFVGKRFHLAAEGLPKTRKREQVRQAQERDPLTLWVIHIYREGEGGGNLPLIHWRIQNLHLGPWTLTNSPFCYVDWADSQYAESARIMAPFGFMC